MKEKYADQDDEERDMRLQLIGAKKVKGFENIGKATQPKKDKQKQTIEEEPEEVVQEEEKEPEVMPTAATEEATAEVAEEVK